MTLTKKLLSLSFDRHGHRPAPSAGVQANGITCAPWEGLHLPHDEAAAGQDVSVTDQELERFLSSHTSGE
jgi:hypothetical protein